MPAKKPSTTTAQPVAAASTNNRGAVNDNCNAAGTTPLSIASHIGSITNGMSRLTPARDLTLGGRGAGAPNKKVFAPNLNAVRNKNTNVKTSKDFTQPRGGRGRGARGSGATRGGRAVGGAGNSSLIQTTGVFSEGAGAVHIRKSTSNSASYTRAGDDIVATRKRNDRKDDKSHDSKVLDLLGGSEDDDYGSSDDETDNDKTDLVFKPVMLTEGEQRIASAINMSDKGRSFLQDSGKAINAPLNQKHQSYQIIQADMEEPPPQYGRYPRGIGAFFDSTQSQLFVLQLPNVLPCVMDDSNEVPEEKSQLQSDQVNDSNGKTNATLSTSKSSVLHQLEEGQIGKILRYRSGRIKLLLGDTRFDLDMGLESGFLQELMSIESNREQRSGDMINLGPIQAKLKATPDWVHLFEMQEAAAKQRRPGPTPATDSK
ncbi:hypothetical protein KR222_008817 [Zaprionus bogoriensis]|nr:hypothetical protein KR222_008817 [Zaprionus bogoriensis]